MQIAGLREFPAKIAGAFPFSISRTRFSHNIGVIVCMERRFSRRFYRCFCKSYAGVVNTLSKCLPAEQLLFLCLAIVIGSSTVLEWNAIFHCAALQLIFVAQ
jgi:hypothetical protein